MENKMTEQEIRDEMRRLVHDAEAKLAEAERFADVHGLSFYFCPEYGMGGEYCGEEQQWYPSSEGC